MFSSLGTFFKGLVYTAEPPSIELKEVLPEEQTEVPKEEIKFQTKASEELKTELNNKIEELDKLKTVEQQKLDNLKTEINNINNKIDFVKMRNREKTTSAKKLQGPKLKLTPEEEELMKKIKSFRVMSDVTKEGVRQQIQRDLTEIKDKYAYAESENKYFLTPKMLEIIDKINVYQYVNNDNISLIDPETNQPTIYTFNETILDDYIKKPIQKEIDLLNGKLLHMKSPDIDLKKFEETIKEELDMKFKSSVSQMTKARLAGLLEYIRTGQLRNEVVMPLAVLLVGLLGTDFIKTIFVKLGFKVDESDRLAQSIDKLSKIVNKEEAKTNPQPAPAQTQSFNDIDDLKKLKAYSVF